MFMERLSSCRSTCHLRLYKVRYAGGSDQMILPGLYIRASTELVKEQSRPFRCVLNGKHRHESSRKIRYSAFERAQVSSFKRPAKTPSRSPHRHGRHRKLNLTFFLSQRIANEKMEGGVGEGAVVTVEYRLACSGTAHLADGVHTGTDIDAWQCGVELESSAAQRRPLTFEVGSRMALPLLDHTVRRLAVGDETGVPDGCGAHRRRMLCSPSATLSLGRSCVLVPSGPSSHIVVRPAAVSGSARDVMGAEWCTANGIALEEGVCLAIRLVALSWPHRALASAVTARLDHAEEAKRRGNELYKAKQAKRALQHYRVAERALAGLDILEDGALKDQYRKVLMAVRLNSAACCVQLGERWAGRAISKCSKVIDLDPQNIKALYRRAQAYQLLSRPDDARQDLVAAASLEPQNIEVLGFLAKLHPV